MAWFLVLQHCDASSTISATFRDPSNRNCAQKLQTEVSSYVIIKSIPVIYFAGVVYVPMWLFPSSLDRDGLCGEPLHHVYVSDGF